MPSAYDMLKLYGPSVAEKICLSGVDARFCQLTDSANQAFGNSDEDLASRLYEQALAEAERLFDAAQDGGSPLIAPMAYTIACHNLAEAKKRAGDLAAAHELKRHAAEKLVATAESPLDPLALRVNCLRHLRHALAFLYQDCADGEADVRLLIDRYRAVGDKLARLAAHVVSEPAGAEAGGYASPKQDRLN